MEAATRGRINRTGDISFEYDAAPVRVGIGNRHRRYQRFRMGKTRGDHDLVCARVQALACKPLPSVTMPKQGR
jgi:hypothetical protein